MYDLPYHKEQDPEVIEAFIAENPFAFLSGCDKNNQPIATQIPIFLEEIDGKKTLRGHIMKNTDHHKAFIHNCNVLVVFTGKHTYVSGTWYSNPHSASTWNYMSVHAHGTLRFLEGDELEAMLQKTSLHFENNNPESSTVYQNLPESYKGKVLKAIIAFEIEVTDIKNVFKLSQDKDEISYQNIIKKLNEQGGDAADIAMEMKKRKDSIARKNTK